MVKLFQFLGMQRYKGKIKINKKFNASIAGASNL